MWDKNLLVIMFPGLRPVLLNYYVRGALTGIGLIDLWVGLADAWNFRQNLDLLERMEKKPSHTVPDTAELASRGRR